MYKKRLICKKMKKNFDCRYQILSESSVSHEEDKMSLYPQLFPVRPGGDREVRRPEGQSSGCVEDIALQSFFKGRI